MNDRLLRRTLWANAAFSVISGAALAIFAIRFAAAASTARPALLGLELPILFELLGVGVIAFGVLCGWAARQPTLSRGLARTILVADIAWVLGSAVVLALPASWTTAGIAGIVVLALVVADLAVLEYLGLRRLNRTA
jgi:hypothetical protein